MQAFEKPSKKTPLNKQQQYSTYRSLKIEYPQRQHCSLFSRIKHQIIGGKMKFKSFPASEFGQSLNHGVNGFRLTSLNRNFSKNSLFIFRFGALYQSDTEGDLCKLSITLDCCYMFHFLCQDYRMSHLNFFRVFKFICSSYLTKPFDIILYQMPFGFLRFKYKNFEEGHPVLSSENKISPFGCQLREEALLIKLLLLL